MDGFSGEQKQRKRERRVDSERIYQSHRGICALKSLSGDAAQPDPFLLPPPPRFVYRPCRAAPRGRAKCNCSCSRRKLATCTHSTVRPRHAASPAAPPTEQDAVTTVRFGCFAHRLCRSLPDDAAAAARAEPARSPQTFGPAPKAPATESSPRSLPVFWFSQPWKLVSRHMTWDALLPAAGSVLHGPCFAVLLVRLPMGSR
jgi:hypothetical protein